ncbi:hypothetical protein D9615_003235 [Tricholomella constricta]|uniref:Uncharacterized protein n=1 Tax=Tricholomella constricta TaxID=117010 RepID=A0A8H5HJ62_9AGAR|nr:hypothetical protein D9615_003235 [Tricholomella constricta]
MRLVAYDEYYVSSTIAKLNYTLSPRIIAYLSAGRSFNATLTIEQQRVRRFRGRHHFCSVLFDVLALRFPGTSGGCLTILTANKSIELLLQTIPRSAGAFTKSDWNAMVAFIISEKTQAEASEFFRDLFSDFFEAALYSTEGRWESYRRRRRKAYGAANSWHSSAQRKRKRSRSWEVEDQRRSKRLRLAREYPSASHSRSSGSNKENLYPDRQFHDRSRRNKKKHIYKPSVVASAWVPPPSKPPILPPAWPTFASTLAPWKPPPVPTSVFATTPALPRLSPLSVSVPMGFWKAPLEPGPGRFSEATEMTALEAWCNPKAGSTAVEHRDVFVPTLPRYPTGQEQGRYGSGTYGGYCGYQMHGGFQRPTPYADSEPGGGASRGPISRRFG